MATSGFFVFFHIFFDEIISILLTVIKVTLLNSVNIYLQDVSVISVRLVVISVSFLVISVIIGDFGNSWQRLGNQIVYRMIETTFFRIHVFIFLITTALKCNSIAVYNYWCYDSGCFKKKWDEMGCCHDDNLVSPTKLWHTSTDSFIIKSRPSDLERHETGLNV